MSYYAPVLEGHFGITRSVRLSLCLPVCPMAQLPKLKARWLPAALPPPAIRDMRTVDPSADGRRSTATMDWCRWPDWWRNDTPPSNCHRRGGISSRRPLLGIPWVWEWEEVGMNVDENGNDPYSRGKNSHASFYCCIVALSCRPILYKIILALRSTGPCAIPP